MHTLKVLFVLLLFPGLAFAASVTVDKDGGQDYTTIQAGVNAAGSGGVVTIYEGATPYYEDVDVASLGAITLQAATGETPIIDGQNSRAYGIKITGSNGFTIDGLTIRNHTLSGSVYGQIDIYTSSNGTIKNCDISGGPSSGSDLADIFCNSGCANMTYEGNYLHSSNIYANLDHDTGDGATIQDNEMSGGRNAIITKNGSSNHIIQRNYIHDLATGGSALIGAMYLRDGSGLIVRNNIIADCNSVRAGINFFDSENAPDPTEAHEVYNNTIINCSSSAWGAIVLEGGIANTKIKNNILYNNYRNVVIEDWGGDGATGNTFDYNVMYGYTTDCDDTGSEGQSCAQLYGSNNLDNVNPDMNLTGDKPAPYYDLSNNDVGDSGVDDDTDVPDSDYSQIARATSQWIGAFEFETVGEICNNGIDDDSDTYTDCADSECDGQTGQSGETCEYGTEVSCEDGYDNDADGSTDCVDSDCLPTDSCTITMKGTWTIQSGDIQ